MKFDGKGREELAITNKVSIGGPVTAFGELAAAEVTPQVQIGFPYNLNEQIIETRDNGGSSTVSGGLASMSTGAGANQSATILSKTPVKYNHGQGGLFRGTAIFTTGVANSTQQIGIGDSFDGYFFGYEGATFGIKRLDSGKPEVRTLTVTTGSSTAENITITLDDDALATVAVTNTGDVTLTANEIAAADYSTTGSGWFTEAVGDTVIFVSWNDGAKSGAYTLSSASTAVGTFAQDLAGVTTTSTAVAQTAWNVDTMDGSGPSGITLDPTKGNVYQIRYQWLGFGMMTFGIQDSDVGAFQTVHQIKYANSNTIPSVQNPTLPICVQAKNTSNTSDMVIKTASLAGFTEGRDEELGVMTGASAQNTGVTSTEIPILSVRSKVVFQSVLNRSKIKILTGTVSTDATKTISIRVLINPTLTGSSWADLSTNTSVVQIDTTATACAGGTEVFVFNMGKTDTQIVDVSGLGMYLLPGSHMTITAAAVSGTGHDVTIATNWRELL